MKELEAEDVIEICKDVIQLQERMRSCFTWQPPMRASDRRSYERRYSQEYDFSYKGHEYSFWQDTECSCRHIYYESCFRVDGSKKDLRLVRSLLKMAEKDLNEEAKKDEQI